MESLAGPQEPVERLCHVWTYMDPARLQRVWIQGYNAQAAVDGAKQIIVAHALTQSMSDCPQLVPLVDAVRANLGRKPREISADDPVVRSPLSWPEVKAPRTPRCIGRGR